MFFLNAVGILYPDVDVDQVRELGQAVRDFATDVRETYDGSTAAVESMGSALSGDSYRAILAGWAHHQGKMGEFDSALGVAAKALDVTADVIEAVQIAVLVELVALAATYTATVFTPFSPATGPLITAAARRILEAMAEFLVWYIAAEVVMAAMKPLLDRFDEFLRSVLRPPDMALPTPGPAWVLRIEPDEVMRYAAILDKHADDLLAHGDKFEKKLDGIDFMTPGVSIGRVEWPSAPDVGPQADSMQPEQLLSPNSGPSAVGIPIASVLGADMLTAGGQSVNAPGGGSVNASEDVPVTPEYQGRRHEAAVSGADPSHTDSDRPAMPAAIAQTGPTSASSSVNLPESVVDSPAGHEQVAGGGALISGLPDRPESDSFQNVVDEAADPVGSGADRAATPSVSAPIGQHPFEPAAGRPQANTSTGKVQGGSSTGAGRSGLGRAAAGPGSGMVHPTGRGTSRTPWSRGAGKAVRPTSVPRRREHEKISPATALEDFGRRDVEGRPTSPPSGNGPSGRSKVTAPKASPPPAAEPGVVSTAHYSGREAAAEFDSVGADPSDAADRPKT